MPRHGKNVSFSPAGVAPKLQCNKLSLSTCTQHRFMGPERQAAVDVRAPEKDVALTKRCVECVSTGFPTLKVVVGL